jgi:protein subunit release factor A
MINPKCYRIDAYWPDGMSVGHGTSGVTVTHLPSGTTASVDATSQHMSLHIAMEMVEWALTYENRLHSMEPKT